MIQLPWLDLLLSEDRRLPAALFFPESVFGTARELGFTRLHHRLVRARSGVRKSSLRGPPSLSANGRRAGGRASTHETAWGRGADKHPSPPAASSSGNDSRFGGYRRKLSKSSNVHRSRTRPWSANPPEMIPRIVPLDPQHVTQYAIAPTQVGHLFR